MNRQITVSWVGILIVLLEMKTPFAVRGQSVWGMKMVNDAYQASKRNKYQQCQGGSPYYFGDRALQSSWWGKRKRREAPFRTDAILRHRWIYYEGWYFEFAKGGNAFYNKHTYSNNKPGMEKKPAGYGVISLACVKACAGKYVSKFGKYDFLGNNCHKFANKISEVICHHTSCPSWCLKEYVQHVQPKYVQDESDESDEWDWGANNPFGYFGPYGDF